MEKRKVGRPPKQPEDLITLEKGETRGQLPSCFYGLDGIVKRYKSPKPKVYFLVKGREVVYVGSTNNLDARLIEHRRRFKFRTAYYLEVPLGADMVRIEKDLILALRPKFNRLGWAAATVKKTWNKNHYRVLDGHGYKIEESLTWGRL
jgi:hypothetical protein